MQRLSGVAQEIADVIGRERALFLIGKLPRMYHRSAQSERVCLYVPKVLPVDHALVRLIGWSDAAKLVKVFGGEILQPGTCKEVYRAFRDKSIARMLEQGRPLREVADLMQVDESLIRKMMRKPPEEPKAANDNNARYTSKARKHERSSKHFRVAS